MKQHTLTVSDRQLYTIKAALLLWERVLLHEADEIEWDEDEIRGRKNVTYWKPGAETLYKLIDESADRGAPLSRPEINELLLTIRCLPSNQQEYMTWLNEQNAKSEGAPA